jgi:hypothetical protein
VLGFVLQHSALVTSLMPNGLPVSTVELAGINGQKHDRQCGQEKHATHDFLATHLHCFLKLSQVAREREAVKGMDSKLRFMAAGRTLARKREHQFGFMPLPSVGATATDADLE